MVIYFLVNFQVTRKFLLVGRHDRIIRVSFIDCLSIIPSLHEYLYMHLILQITKCGLALSLIITASVAICSKKVLLNGNSFVPPRVITSLWKYSLTIDRLCCDHFLTRIFNLQVLPR